MNRRRFIAGLLAAPALVRVSSLDLLPKGVALPFGGGDPWASAGRGLLYHHDDVWFATLWDALADTSKKVVLQSQYSERLARIFADQRSRSKNEAARLD